MNFLPIQPINNDALNVKSTQKSTTNLNNYKGPSFSENLIELNKATNMGVAARAGSAALEFNRQKEEQVDTYSFLEEEEELVEDHMSRIREIIDDLTEKE